VVGGLGDSWRKVVEEALGSLVPVYDKMNKVMSFGKDIEWRKTGIKIAFKGGERILDAGCGPGVMAEVLKQVYPDAKLVLMDALWVMLETAKKRTRGFAQDYVRAVFEKLPFKDQSFDGIMMGFSFRDSKDMESALDELARVLSPQGVLLIVDISKPDNVVARALIGFYWHYLVPVMAMLFAPRFWKHYKVLHTTYTKLPKNSQLKALVQKRFEEVHMITRMMGGLLILVARKPQKTITWRL
jgi:demethylmenaquinone methyltransferase/2-methoxy-6-polyprenyl-1,4-benzoquinol methylase